ncbi:MAG: hypothetical protein R6V10_13620 [bacterium]
MKLKEKMEKWMAAAAFAEANEPEAARQMAGFPAEPVEGITLDDMTTAIAFSEAGELDKAREYMGARSASPAPALDLESLGVKVWYGTAALA